MAKVLHWNRNAHAGNAVYMPGPVKFDPPPGPGAPERPETDPPLLANLLFWFDPWDTSSLSTTTSEGGGEPSDGSTVSFMKDRSANTANVIQATEAWKPVYLATGLNGRPCLDYDAASITEFRNMAVSGAIGTGGEFFTVMKHIPVPSLSSFSTYMKIKVGTSEAHRYMNMNNGPPGRRASNTNLDGSWHSGIAFAAAEISSNTDLFLPAADACIFGNRLATASALNNGVTVGGDDSTAEQRNYQGVIGEQLAYDRKLTDSERVSVENYLLTKWFDAGPAADEIVRGTTVGDGDGVGYRTNWSVDLSGGNLRIMEGLVQRAAVAVAPGAGRITALCSGAEHAAGFGLVRAVHTSAVDQLEVSATVVGSTTALASHVL